MPLIVQNATEQDPLSSLKNLLHHDLEKVNQIITQYLESSVSLIPTIGHHLIDAGGKRIRPLLTIASHRLFNDQEDGHEMLKLAAAVEFIHTATLLHDDVVDNSELRRGFSTASHLWGNKPSILVGDFLFARSFQLMIASRHPNVLTILANAAASIAEGEVLQLSLCHNLEVSLEDLLRVIEAKTAVLFASACEVGALTASHSHNAQALRNYGLNMGMAFQIIDDILDYQAHASQLGKTIGDDFREGKITLPILLTYPHCTSDEKFFWHRTLIDHQQGDTDLIKALDILQKHQGLEKAYELAKEYGQQAKESLQMIPNHPLKTHLLNLIDHCLQRQT